MSYFLPYLILFALTTAPAQSLESFQREAEQALRRPISIIEASEMGANLGETFCDQNPVLIRIRSGIDTKLSQAVLAHELGHALLCGRGILSSTNSIPPFDGPLSIVPSLGATIGSCYIDPLADAEAEKRGFKTSEVADAFFRRSTSHSRTEIEEFLTKYGELAADFAALAIYCVALRPHSFELSKLEAQVADKPTVLMKLMALKNHLGNQRCVDSGSCFVLTKHLRDELALQKLVTIKNPATGIFE
jgi:hypothetical protein